MIQPTLVVMAAGMGSRFGGLKQVTPVDDMGHAILDYSICDARRAGFGKVVFIIKHSIDADFRAGVGARTEAMLDTAYVYQETDALPAGFSVPEGREKPWGTGHAVACARSAVDGPFAVINADDFYGAGAFEAASAFLRSAEQPGCYAMAGYRLRNTVTENGTVSRGICTVQDGLLTGITERTKIEKRGNAAAYLEADGTHPLTGDETVSMNFWCFTPDVFDALDDAFVHFLRDQVPLNPLKSEFYLPSVVDTQIAAGKAKVSVLPCEEVWHGVTYREDLGDVKEALSLLRAAERYPEFA